MVVVISLVGMFALGFFLNATLAANHFKKKFNENIELIQERVGIVYLKASLETLAITLASMPVEDTQITRDRYDIASVAVSKRFDVEIPSTHHSLDSVLEHLGKKIIEDLS